MGYLLLEGGAEFGGQMRTPDLKAIECAGGFEAPIRIIPTAAAPDNNHQRAGNYGKRWFEGLGAKDVAVVPLIDQASASDKKIAASLRNAKLIYLLGGFTHYLGQTLKGSLAWNTAMEANQNGAVIAGSSAGAMVLCEFYFDPRAGKVVEGLNLISNALVLPHYNTFGRDWALRLVQEIPHVTLLGVDERTGMIAAGPSGVWSVLGQGGVTVYRNGASERFRASTNFSI